MPLFSFLLSIKRNSVVLRQVTTFGRTWAKTYEYAGQIVVSDDLLAQYPRLNDLPCQVFLKIRSFSEKEYSIYTFQMEKQLSYGLHSDAFSVFRGVFESCGGNTLSERQIKPSADLNELRENRMKAGEPLSGC